MMCWWAENPNGDEFKHHLARVPDYLWLAEDGMKMQVRTMKITCLKNITKLNKNQKIFGLSETINRFF